MIEIKINWNTQTRSLSIECKGGNEIEYMGLLAIANKDISQKCKKTKIKKDENNNRS